jgi:ubiquinone/menaquinone biosynthesis C-methylase UbiE
MMNNQDLDVGDYFSEISAQYDAESRLSRTCALAICKIVADQLNESETPLLLDVGGGVGYFEALILKMAPSARVINVDQSERMLEEAAAHFAALGLEERVELKKGDAHHLPFEEGAIPYAFMSYVIHLLDAPRALSEVHRVLVPGGQYFLVTFAQEDMLSQIYHAHFPRFFDIDSQRFAPQEQLEAQIRESEFEIQSVDKFPYAIPYASVDEVIELVRGRPFSTLSTKFYSESELEAALKVFEERLRTLYGAGPVFNECQLTMITSVKAR